MPRRAVRAAGIAAALSAFLCMPALAIEPAAPEGLPAAEPPPPGADAVQGLAAPPPGAPATKLIPDSFADAIGTWDLSLDGSNNRCQLVLSSENTRNGRVVRFPAGCRRALPPLAQTVGWLFADGGIRLVDKDIRPLLKFVARKDGSSLIAEASGKTYSLVPLQTMAMLPPAPDASGPAAEPPAATDAATSSTTLAAAPSAEAATNAALRGAEPEASRSAIRNSSGEIPGSQPVLPSGALVPSPRPEPARATAASDSADPVPTPGVYALDRFNDKDVCRIELEASRVAGKGGTDALSPARILPGCRDSGIATFDPVSWRFANGHMTLKAKRGHAVNLVPSGEGTWRRDPDTGTTLVLRKVER